jgi:hypothetical protein
VCWNQTFLPVNVCSNFNPHPQHPQIGLLQLE